MPTGKTFAFTSATRPNYLLVFLPLKPLQMLPDENRGNQLSYGTGKK